MIMDVPIFYYSKPDNVINMKITAGTITKSRILLPLKAYAKQAMLARIPVKEYKMPNHEDGRLTAAPTTNGK